jgi:hypothetical protein
MKYALNDRGNITQLFCGRKNIGQVENMELLPFVEKQSKCMKFVDKKSTVFRSKKKLERERLRMLFIISVSLTFKQS